MEKKLVSDLFNNGVSPNKKTFEKKIKPIRRLTKEIKIVDWFDDGIKHNVILTGGIGDVIAVESFVFKKYHNKIDNVFLATRGYKEIELLLKTVYPEINIINLFPKFPDEFYAFMTAKQVLDYLYDNDYYNIGVIGLQKSDNVLVDLSIYPIFNKIKNGELKYDESSFIIKKLNPLNNFDLPNEYVSVITTSNRDPYHKARGRNLTTDEIQNVVDVCKKNEIKGVCVYCNCIKPHNDLIHIKNSTMLESLELVKNSVGYIGIDSWLSVIGGYVFNNKNIKIKSFNQHAFDNRECYYPLVNRSDLFSPSFKDLKDIDFFI